MPALVEGLRLLHHADPMVQVMVQDSGEHVLCAAGALAAACAGTLCTHLNLILLGSVLLPLPACQAAV
jgi:translation elongation factor EF-G